MCGEVVTEVLPSGTTSTAPEVPRCTTPRAHLSSYSSPRARTSGRAAGVERAVALALTYRDDQVNMMAALFARTLNPSVRFVVRMFHRRRGRHLERLLDRAAGPSDDPAQDTSTTVLSDADTALPEFLVAAAVGHGHTLQVEGKAVASAAGPGNCGLATGWCSRRPGRGWTS
ncbi:NAD-binding protein [Streptomyces sp. NPDC058964]|uniref:NAD-binding protein n=1 Tax=Streptomyces sp. NPDC058964 TaxID=3346681 RepID=UPI00369E765D